MRWVLLVIVYSVLISSGISVAWKKLVELEQQEHRDKIERDFMKAQHADL